MLKKLSSLQKKLFAQKRNSSLCVALFFSLSANTSFAQSPPLARCVDSAATLKNIQDILEVNKSNDRKYNGYRVELQKEPETELAIRLVYAEVLAAHCPEHQNSLVEKIAAVVANRILNRQGDIQGVVFERNQFASSLHIYKNSRYRDFLCPKDAKLWQHAAKNLLLFLKQKKTNLPPDVVNYFLYKHDSRWTHEPWKLKENFKDQKEPLRSCLRVFHNPNWK